MPVTTRSAKRTPHPKLSLDIQLCVLEWMIALGKADSSVDVSPCAAVCKAWQVIIERELFRHLTLTLKDLKLFRKYCHGRKHYVKHILLEIWLSNEPGSAQLDQVCFTEATETLFLDLSTWEGHGITLEFGIVPPSEFPDQIFYPGHSRRFHIHHGPAPRKRSLSGHLRHLDRLKERRREDGHGVPFIGADWMERVLRILSYRHLTFHDDSAVGTSLLASVTCVSKLLIRRRYMPVICPKSLSTIIKSLPALESIQLERWSFGKRSYDDEWDSALDQTNLALPESLKEFTYYEECGTNYHQRNGQRPQRRNPKLNQALINVADRIEHIAVSFIASSLLNPNANFEFKALKTLAITSDNLINAMDGLIDQPQLLNAATAAKRMPKLEGFEIWCHKTGRAGIFTYQRLGQYSSCITWKESWGPQRISERVQKAWKQVGDEENGTFEVNYKLLELGETPGETGNLGKMRSHLLLGNRILHDITWTQV